MWFRLVLTLLGTWLGHAAAQAQGCAVAPVAVLAVRDTAGVLTVAARLGGRDVAMVLDTGSEGGLVTPEAAHTLPVDAATAAPPVALQMYGANGGQRIARMVSVPDLQLGGLHVALAAVAVSRLPFQPMLRPPIAGLIGADLLSHFDLELDVAGGTARLYAPGCADPPRQPGWHGARAVGLLRVGDRLVGQAVLDGHAVSALVDTGARGRVVGLATALALGIDEAELGADSGGTASGLGAQPGFYRWHRFRSFSFAGHGERDVTLTVSRLDDVADMLLGADWFAAHTVWISWARATMWVR